MWIYLPEHSDPIAGAKKDFFKEKGEGRVACFGGGSMFCLVFQHFINRITYKDVQ